MPPSNSYPILDALKFRYACKKFDPSKRVSDNDFLSILEAARLSPSSYGFEPWKLLVVQNPELREALRPHAGGAHNSFNGASHFVILLARKSADLRYDSEYISHMLHEVQGLPEATAALKRSSFENFQRESFKLLESDRAMFDWASKQTYIALANMLTIAASMGIDSCPIEGFNRAGVEQKLSALGLLDLEHFGVSVMAGFGYRAETAPAKTRQSIEEIVQWV